MKALLFLCAFSAALSGVARAAPLKTFALVVGVNRSPEVSIPPLRYADDDAVRYRELFRALGTETELLASVDENTRRLHPDAAAEARPPRRDLLSAAVQRLARAAGKARRAGARVALYFVYAGHGRVRGGAGAVALEDDELGGGELLRQVIDPIGADETHVIVDACHSYFLVLGRGPGGSRRPMGGFVELGALADRRDVGLLLSTSSARESHEWAAYQAGIFSQEVRSGLYGAADADGDGRISYAEISAFIDRANAAVRNERYRPEVYGRPPAGGGTLVDLRPALSRRIEVGVGGGHQFIEDTAGVRHADFHNDAPVRLVRPGEGRLYLRRKADDREIVLPEGVAVLNTADLPLVEPRSTARDAANDAFDALFAMPFGSVAVSTYRFREVAGGAPAAPPGGPAWWERPSTLLGLGLGGAGLFLGAWGATTLIDARDLHDRAGPALSQQDADALNRDIDARNRQGGALLGMGLAALAGAVVSVLLDSDEGTGGAEPPRRTVRASSGGAVRATWELMVAPASLTGGVRGRF